ncbi:MAG TPA: lamin tail domain-containing protein, partial [Gaiellaceae bacterium]|nr:lamin tail domain-containing protein [Gaiellaceae bacterium]
MVRIRLLAPLVAIAVLLGAASARGGGSTGVVVGQLFAGGGNAGAPYTNDFVELFNRGAAPVDLDGWTLQYASAAGTTWQATPLAGTLAVGGHYLLQLASTAAVGAVLPAPDATGTTNLAVSGGKVALVRDATPLTCGAAPGSCSAVASVEDVLGYGTASDYEGTGPASAPTATSALVRAGGGCTDSDDNAADFSAAPPDPQNSSS